MAALPRLPDWLPHHRVAWFVVEGVVLSVLGVLIRDLVGPSEPSAVGFGNILLFVGVGTALVAATAYVVLVSWDLYGPTG